MDQKPDATGKCPVTHAAKCLSGHANRDWWPNQLDVQILHQMSGLAEPWVRHSITQRRSRSSISTR